MEGYRGLLNSIALDILDVDAFVPHSNLAIGGDEAMKSIPLLVPTEYKPVKQRLFISNTDMSYEQAHLDGTNATLSMEDFVLSGGFYGDWFNNGY